MKKFFLPGIIIATVAIIAGGIFLTSNRQQTNLNPSPSPAANTYEYFWGNGCPHCAKVEEFLKTWDKRNKINIDEKEVWENPANANVMAERAKACGIDTNQLAVPMLVTPDGKCIEGDQPIIDYLKNLEL